MVQCCPMRIGRLVIAVFLAGGIAGLMVWLVVRGSESASREGRIPSVPAANRKLRPPLLNRPPPGAEPPTTPDAASPNPFERRKGQVLLELLAGGTNPSASAAAIESYLVEHNRNAVSLVTVWQVTGNVDYLREASTRFPNDPLVQFSILAADAFPDDRAKWITLFKQAAPMNPLANYLAAHDWYRQTQPDEAAAELFAAAGKPVLDDYTATSLGDRQELFTSSGVAAMESKGDAIAGALPLVQGVVEKLRALSQEIAGAQGAASSNGDSALAQRLIQAQIDLGRQLNTPGPARMAMEQSAGIDIEQTALRQLPPDDVVDWLGQSPASRLADLQQQQEQLQSLSATAAATLPRLGDAELLQYVDLVIQSGEVEALKWLAGRGSTSP